MTPGDPIARLEPWRHHGAGEAGVQRHTGNEVDDRLTVTGFARFVALAVT
jgi:hypothetical protein